ncbi:MAG TPA: hypothetical protein DCS12_01915 [Clostridiales bacterium]|nr:hypothetical protein [Clostridiales bacterium]
MKTEIATKQNNAETISSIPDNWNFGCIKDLVRVKAGYAIKSSDFTDSGVGVIKIKNIGNRIVDIENTDKISLESFNKLASDFILSTGDIVVAMTGATIGKVGKIKSTNQKYALNQRVARFISENKHDLEFVFQYSDTKDFIDAINNYANGAAQQNISADDIASIQILIPPTNERRIIAEILSSLDDKIELNRKINSNLEKIASLLFKQWFVDFEFPNESGKPFKSSGGKMIDSELGEIPYSWTVGKLGDCFDIKYGKSDKDISEDGAYSVYGAGGLLGFSNTFDYKGPQVIVGCRGTCGNISIIFEDSKITHNSLIISNEWGNFFLYLYLKNINIKDVITGSTQPQITIKDLSSLNVLLPSKEIVDTFSQIIDPLFLNIKTNLLENIYLNKIRDSLLPRLMNGKIRVKI